MIALPSFVESTDNGFTTYRFKIVLREWITQRTGFLQLSAVFKTRFNLTLSTVNNSVTRLRLVETITLRECQTRNNDLL
ncbi:hypothetical protein OAF34_04280 [Pirellulaceae bacterium]|nr:hypothetical protein [Pirellulaceae bacterium]